MKDNKLKTIYVCSNCGESSPRWMGRCPSCGAWNTMVEDVVVPEPKAAARSASARPSGVTSITARRLSEVSTTEEKSRIVTGISELDRVLGGGVVLGSVVLLGGEPGAGKSTLLLQLCGAISDRCQVLYITGEESVRQIKLRADRLQVPQQNIHLAAETDIDDICGLIEQTKPDLVVIDSIQTMHCNDVSSSAGSVSQVKECSARLLTVAKNCEIPTFIVGHVNKDGAIAGPKVLEHIVDAVLLFEGDRQMTYRILRAVKNRYGSTNEIGVFDMGDRGLRQVENPSLAMLSGRPQDSSGTCVTAVMEGTRPLLAEIQGLATTTGFGTPRRMSTGFDHNRLALILAVLEKRAGYYFSNLDTYINIVGGLRLDEPGVDLAVAMSLISSLKDKPIREDTVVFGEIGLAGELRSISHSDLRITEALRLGFTRCILPYHGLKNLAGKTFDGMEIIGARNIRQAFEAAV